MAAPVLTSLNPTSVDISAGLPTTVHIIGTGFLVDSVIVINGSDDVGIYVSATEMTTVINTATAGGPSTMQVAVRNAAAVSNALPLSLTGTVPTSPLIINVNPHEAYFDDDPMDLTIDGMRFSPSSQVLWGGIPFDTYAYVNATTMTAHLVPLDATYDPSDNTAEIRVSTGGVWSNGFTFQFNEHEEPVISGSPNTEAIPDQYMSPEPPDVYRVVANPDYVPPEGR